MNLNDFINAAERTLPAGYVFDNPRSGTTEIIRNRGGIVVYLRGKSRIQVHHKHLFQAYSYFKGETVSSTDLRQYLPSVFDSKARPAGHSCNSTFMFHLLEKIDLVDGSIRGRGVSGYPFYVKLR